jgi:hypothetical protein
MVLGDLDPCASARGRVSRISCREIRQDRTVSQRGGPCSPEKRDVHRDMYECLDTDTALRSSIPTRTNGHRDCFRCRQQVSQTAACRTVAIDTSSFPPFLSLRRPGFARHTASLDWTASDLLVHLISHTNCPNLDSLD